MLTFLIMAGGSGERFWPLSTKTNPKQLLHVFNSKSLIRLTYERILPICDNDHIFIATNEIQADKIKAEISELDSSRIIIEPGFKDTASAIAYGSLMISKYIKDATIAVLASDALIKDEEGFRNILIEAENVALAGSIVTLGIKPTYPETGYGYIEAKTSNLNVANDVIAFKEKPSYDIAKEYVDAKRYFWNSGMFIFKSSVMDEAFKMYSKIHYDVKMELDKMIDSNLGVDTANKVRDTFNKFEKKSIDFAVMEHAKNIKVIPCNIGWNDVGSYLAFEELFTKDNDSNVIRNTNTILVDSNNNIIISDGNYQSLAMLGVSDMIIAITKDNILVCPKGRNQEIKKIISKKQ